MNKNYSIRPDYRPNLKAQSFEFDVSGSYWTPERLRISNAYQYDVYRIAHRHANNIGSRAVNMLDVGCGPAGKHAYFAIGHNRPKITLVDQPSVREIAFQSQPDSEFYEADLEQPQVSLPTKYDIVICADVVEHLKCPDPCIQFLKMCTSDDGLMYISTPDRNRLYGRDRLEPGHPCHVREWNFHEFAAYLESHDLKIRSHRILHQQRVGIFRKMLDPILDRAGLRTSRHSCQLAICALA